MRPTDASISLAAHETGHLVFGFAGETLTLLGGTLFQLLVPAAFVPALWRQGDRHGATVPLWQLPLVGGGEHDWALCWASGTLLREDQRLGGAVYFVGLVLYGIASVAGRRLLHPAGGTGRKAR